MTSRSRESVAPPPAAPSPVGFGLVTPVAALVVLVAWVLLSTGCKRDAVPEEDTSAASDVSIQAATLRRVPKQLTVTGMLQAEQRTDLAANATGRVTAVYVEIGQRVEAGAPLAQLDARGVALNAAEARANVASASAQYATAARDCSRYGSLLSKGAITRQEYDRAIGTCSANGASASAAAAHAKAASQVVQDATIRAPFAGIVTDKMVHVGDFVRPESPVVALLSGGQLRLRLTVAEPDMQAAKEGAPVFFETVGVPGRQFRATLKYIGHEVRPQTRDVIVEAVVENDDGLLMPGMFVTAHLLNGETTQPVVPRGAVVVTETGPRVMAMVGQHFEQRVVQLGAMMGNDVAIVDGVKSGEQVVVRNLENHPVSSVALN
jgi:membrane fusion protein (multidrug efflux system)